MTGSPLSARDQRAVRDDPSGVVPAPGLEPGQQDPKSCGLPITLRRTAALAGAAGQGCAHHDTESMTLVREHQRRRGNGERSGIIRGTDRAPPGRVMAAEPRGSAGTLRGSASVWGAFLAVVRVIARPGACHLSWRYPAGVRNVNRRGCFQPFACTNTEEPSERERSCRRHHPCRG